MRDPQTQRGRGFGFIKMHFENRDKAQDGKQRILDINGGRGHLINDKKVDVKSADDYQKPPNAPDRTQQKFMGIP